MKKLVCLLAIAALGVGTAAAYNENAYDGTPGSGVINSPHDMNIYTDLQRDDQGRVCAFCHTPHHAEDLGGEYNPLWSHTPFTGSGTPYESATFNGDDSGFVDPLIGPSRLCMSCHDGVIAPDQHYGNLFPGTSIEGSFPYGSDAFGGIAVGLGGQFGNDHPIGFDVDAIGTDNGGIHSDTFVDRNWYVGSSVSSVAIADGLYQTAPGGPRYFTCATCHDVHNMDNVRNDATTQYDSGVHRAGDVEYNYFVFSPQSGSQLCISCHNK